MKIMVSKYKKVADFCYELFRIAELKLYSSKFSKKRYTQHQHLFLLVYRQFSIKAKAVKIQKVEAMCRVIAHNIDRLIESEKNYFI